MRMFKTVGDDSVSIVTTRRENEMCITSDFKM